MNTVDRISQEIEERPPDYRAPDLNPAGLRLEPKALAPGVYALMANIPPKDNNGLIVGEKAALVVDAGINGAIAQHIQDLVRHVTDTPLRYLVNTTYHGDHTFGNYAFPDQVTIISTRKNKASMRDLEHEKRIRAENLGAKRDAIAGVTQWRLPDMAFDHYLEIDLGRQIVELWHFGPDNAPGDTIVYVPSARVAWTGNFLMRASVAPMLLEGGPSPYIETLKRMRATLDVETIVPGHGPMGEARPALDSLCAYLEELRAAVTASLEAGRNLEATLAAYPLPERFVVPQAAISIYNQHAHRLNVVVTYRALEQARTADRR